MKIMNQILFLLVFIFCFYTSSISNQTQKWWQRDFGIGVVKYKDMSTYSAKDSIYSESNTHSKIIAILNGRSLSFANGKTVSPFKRMIEYDYEIPGWAILKFNSDSSWANVTLDPYNLSTPQTGWINLNKKHTSVSLWSKLLPKKSYLFFLNSNNIEFYQNLSGKEKKVIQLVKFKNSDEFDYILKPLLKNGNWLQVELLSPSPYCKSEKIEVKPKTLWIKFLKNNQRPNVFFYTRGC
jgi:hypothetical protein